MRDYPSTVRSVVARIGVVRAVAIGISLVGSMLISELNVSPAQGANRKKSRTATTTTLVEIPGIPGREACYEYVHNENGQFVLRGGPRPHVVDAPYLFLGNCLRTRFFAYPDDVFVMAMPRHLIVSMLSPAGKDPGKRLIAEIVRDPNNNTNVNQIRFLRPGLVSLSYRQILGSRRTGVVKIYTASIQVLPRPVS